MSKVTLSFSDPAQLEWERIFNDIERSIRPGGAFCEARDYASKVAENIARLAGVFHAFEGYEGTKISVETLSSAAQVVLWYAQEFVRLFSPPDPLEESIEDAHKLENWLIHFFRSRREYYIQANFIRQYGPNSLRNRNRLEWALNCLVSGSRVSFCWQGKKRLICLNPAFFNPFLEEQRPIGFFPLRPM